jgi:hypothetical protein
VWQPNTNFAVHKDLPDLNKMVVVGQDNVTDPSSFQYDRLTNAAADNNVVFNVWSLITVVVDSSATATLYINAVQAVQGILAYPPTVARPYCYLGRSLSNLGDDDLVGDFAHFGFWQRTLSPSEITAMLSLPPASIRRASFNVSGVPNSVGPSQIVDLSVTPFVLFGNISSPTSTLVWSSTAQYTVLSGGTMTWSNAYTTQVVRIQISAGISAGPPILVTPVLSGDTTHLVAPIVNITILCQTHAAHSKYILC